MDDNRIVELYLLRDETAIKQTAEKFGSRLRSLAYGIVDDQQTADVKSILTWKHGTPSHPMSREVICMRSLLGLLVTFL